jgi:hypothetical protein
MAPFAPRGAERREMTASFRHARISELMQRYRPERVGKTEQWSICDRETDELVPNAIYDNEPMARAGCRLQAAADIERLYVPARAEATARVTAVIAQTIAEQSDPAWAASLICDFFEGAKA